MNELQIDLTKLGNPSLELIEGLLEGLKSGEVPDFAKFILDPSPLPDVSKGMADAKNIVIIGHGGSVTTFKGILGTLGWKYLGDRSFYLIDTVDPTYVKGVLDRTSPENTHVVAISKSGNTLTVLEVLSCFRDYPTTVVTQPGYGTLRKIAKMNSWTMVDVPEDIGGRFSGGTASTVLPAMVLGIDVAAYLEGLKDAYRFAREEKDLIELSGAFYMVERLGKRTIFMPVYSKGLSAFNDLVTQLFHETLSKGRKGLTVLCYEGPECQHHTNQRILDGPEDVATLFILVDGQEGEEISWADSAIEYKGVPMSEIGPYSMKRAIWSEAKGVMGSMEELQAPFASITLKGEDERSIGLYVGTLQYLAYYFALLRRVEPFDQPAVEKAKEIALGLRIE